MARTKFQNLQHVKSKFCHGDATKADVKRAASIYVHAAAVKAPDQVKGRRAAQVKANRVLRAGCKTTTVITGRKKRGAKRRKRK